MDTFVVEIPVGDKKKMAEFQEIMNANADATVKHTQDLAEELGVSDMAAMDIVYLRTRSRWTQEAEDELIRIAKAGEPMPNMNEYP